MKEMVNRERIKMILERNRGFITRRQIDEASIPSWFLTDFVRKNNLVRIDKGFYANDSWIRDDFFIFQYKYPKYVFSFGSALFLLDMTDDLPENLEITGPKNYRPFSPKDNTSVIHTDNKETTYNLGIVEVQTNQGNTVRAYNAEKTICDLIRNSKHMDFETYMKALRGYSKREDKDMGLLLEYAKMMGIYKKVSELMAVVMYED